MSRVSKAHSHLKGAKSRHPSSHDGKVWFLRELHWSDLVSQLFCRSLSWWNCHLPFGFLLCATHNKCLTVEFSSILQQLFGIRFKNIFTSAAARGFPSADSTRDWISWRERRQWIWTIILTATGDAISELQVQYMALASLSEWAFEGFAFLVSYPNDSRPNL